MCTSNQTETTKLPIGGPGFASPWYLAITRARSSVAIARDQRALISFVITAIVGLNIYARAQPTVTMRCLASFLIILVAIPIWIWNSGRDTRMPLLAFVAFFYGIYYALPIFMMGRYSLNWYSESTIPDPFLEYALFLSCLGWLAMLVGYYLAIPPQLASFVPKLTLNWTDWRTLQGVGSILGTIGCIVYYIGFSARSYSIDNSNLVDASLRQVVFFLGEAAALGIGILFVLQYVGCLERPYKLYLWVVLIPVRLLLGLATGAVYQAMSLVLFLLLLHSALKRRIPWSTLLAGMVTFMILQPTKTLFRESIEAQTNFEQSPIQRVRDFLSTTVDVVTGQTDRTVDMLQMSIDRLNCLSTLATTAALTPADIPFWHGKSYEPLLEKLIPRFMLPNKLNEDAGQTFGHRYGLLTVDDQTTSYNLSQLVEAYVNFGLLGVAVVMFFIGIMYNISQYAFVHPAMGLGALVGGSYVMSGWFNIESNASLVLGGLPLAVAFVGCVHVLISLLGSNGIGAHTSNSR